MIAVASGVFVSAMLLVQLLEGYLPSDIGRLPVVGEWPVYVYCGLRCRVKRFNNKFKK